MEPIISKNIRVRHPNHFKVGKFSIIDDFCYFSTRVEVGIGSHIANGCSVGGGKDYLFRLGDYSSLSSGVKIWCSSNDYAKDIIAINPGVDDLGDNPISGDVTFDNYTGVGSNTVIMPDNHIPEGTSIGALSYVPPRFKFKPWSVYAGVPIKFIKARDKENVLKQVARMDKVTGRKK